MNSFLTRDNLESSLGSFELQELVCLESDASLLDLITKMNEESFGSVGITKDGSLVGIITEKDFLTRFHLIENFILNGEEVDITSLMTKNPIVFNEDKTILDAMKVMTSLEFRHLPVKKDNTLRIISVRDILNIICNKFSDDLDLYQPIKNWRKEDPSLQEIDILEKPHDTDGISSAVFETPLKRIYNSSFIYIDHEGNIENLINKMIENEVQVAFVMEYETTFVGIITERDLLKKVFSKKYQLSDSIIDIMTASPDYLSVTHHFGNALKNMEAFDYRNMPVVAQDGYPIGNVALLDLMSLFYAQFASN